MQFKNGNRIPWHALSNILGVTIARKMLPICTCRMYYNQEVSFSIHCMFLHQLPRTIVSHISSYRKCTIKYKLGGHMCISVEHVLWVNFKLKVVQAAIVISYS